MTTARKKESELPILARAALWISSGGKIVLVFGIADLGFGKMRRSADEELGDRAQHTEPFGA